MIPTLAEAVTTSGLGDMYYVCGDRLKFFVNIGLQ